MTSRSTVASSKSQSSPEARKMSPFRDSQSPPCTPKTTAKLWDEYERRALENARMRETTGSNSTWQTRFSSDTILGMIKSYDPNSSPQVPPWSPPPMVSSPRFETGFASPSRAEDGTSGATVAICKSCRTSIHSSPGICEQCKKTISLPLSSGESTPPLTPSCRNFASTDLSQLQKCSISEPTTPSTSTTKKKWHRRGPSTASIQLVDPPIRLSSLRPPPAAPDDNPRSSNDSQRQRKISLTDPNDAFLRFQTSRRPVPSSASLPSAPITPPSTSHSHHSSVPCTRPVSLANITTPPVPAATIQNSTTSYHKRSSTRHMSSTPSEYSNLYQYGTGSTSTTPPPSLSRASYNLQHTTSAWDDWDSEEEEEKAGLVKYWRGRKWRSSRGSLGGQGSGSRRESEGQQYEAGVSRKGGEVGKKRRSFVRVISCGCAKE